MIHFQHLIVWLKNTGSAIDFSRFFEGLEIWPQRLQNLYSTYA